MYNFQDRTLNPARLRAYDEYNRQTILSNAERAEVEMRHEIRKQESLKVFNDVISKKPNRKYLPAAAQSNLSALKLEGLASLNVELLLKKSLSVKQTNLPS